MGIEQGEKRKSIGRNRFVPAISGAGVQLGWTKCPSFLSIKQGRRGGAGKHWGQRWNCERETVWRAVSSSGGKRLHVLRAAAGAAGTRRQKRGGGGWRAACQPYELHGRGWVTRVVAWTCAGGQALQGVGKAGDHSWVRGGGGTGRHRGWGPEGRIRGGRAAGGQEGRGPEAAGRRTANQGRARRGSPPEHRN